MKKVFLSILAVAALASCVEDLGAGDAIDFGAPFVGNTTKAADPSYGTPQKDGEGNLLPESPAALTKFDVYGTVQGSEGVVNIFDDVEVTGTVGQDNWKYAEAHNQYWIPGAIYNFAAVVDAGVVNKDANKMPKTLVPAKTNTGFYKDMLYAFNGPITAAAAAPYAKVNFAFSHLLAKAQFVVTSTTKDGYYYNVKGIKIYNFSTGEYTISTGKWDKESATADTAYDLGDILNVTAANNNQTNATQVLLIPTATTFKVEFIVELRNSNGVDANGDPKDVLLRTIDCTGTAAKVVEIKNANGDVVGLQKGHAYNFNLALTAGSLIEFTVTNNPTWATPSDNVNLGL